MASAEKGRWADDWPPSRWSGGTNSASFWAASRGTNRSWITSLSASLPTEGGFRWHSVTRGFPESRTTPQLYLEIAQDIRERLLLRDKLLEIEKFTLMGRMAAGIAHHLNTPLTAMLLQTEMLAHRLRGREEEAELALIENRIRFCQVFVRDLLVLFPRSGAATKTRPRCAKSSGPWPACCVLVSP